MMDILPGLSPLISDVRQSGSSPPSATDPQDLCQNLLEINEAILADSEPGAIGWSDLEDVQSASVKTGTEPEAMPFG
ncbi:hypothetical protein AB0E25_39755 [Streptomyces bobili]|uniref:hypothetical protein n=1 Tax=Streptomyces bobili TaxID=67280 RepID=UPI0033E57D95